jgi:hypothetical protein
MCYTRRDQSFEEEARKLRAKEERRAKAASERPPQKRSEKPLTEKVREMVGATK